MVVKVNKRYEKVSIVKGGNIELINEEPKIPKSVESSNTTGFKIDSALVSRNGINTVPNTLEPNLNIENLPSNFVKKRNFTFNRNGKNKIK